MESNKLYTYDRLSEFVDSYTAFVKKTKEEESNPATENYKYYNFETSPDAVTSDSIGRFGSSLFANIDSIWKPMSGSNGINAWKLNLGEKMIALKNTHNADVTNNLVTGLSYKIKQFNNVYNITDITKLNVLPYDLLAQIAYVDTVSNISDIISNSQCPSGYKAAGSTTPAACFTPYSSILSTIVEGVSNPNVSVYTPSPNTNTNNIVSIEWEGYFHQSTNGIYTFKATIPDNCLYYIWFGDKSICEFLSTNADISNTNNKHMLIIDNKQPIRIRIQCIFIDQIQPTLNLDISRIKLENQSTIDEPVSITDSFYNSSVQPFAFYTAFVSSNQQQFLNNEFTCYSLVTNTNGILNINGGDLTQFYRIFRQNYPDVIDLKYDYNSSNRLSYGTIPSINTQYTIQVSSTTPPFAYSIYRLYTDPRMGNTYQINTQMNDQTLYSMHKFSDNKLNYANDFSTKTGYYPSSSLLTGNSITNKSGLECKEQCISDATCNNYYTFTSNNDPKCVISTGTPEFNRVIPANSTISIDPNSSSLYMRNYQLDITGSNNCGTLARPSNVIPVNTTNNYSTNFEYSNYNFDGTNITTPQQIGICGSPAYQKQSNDAYEILYSPATYFTGGTWTESFTSDSQDSSKTTQAIDDTSDAIQTNLGNEEIYANKMESINSNKSQLEHTLIPNYKQTRKIMEGNPIYDYKGDSLLYFRNKPIPQVREKRVMDNNQQYVTSQLMLSLGTLSAATLIVFAIMLARE